MNSSSKGGLSPDELGEALANFDTIINFFIRDL
jgi:hypothetical protein